MLDVKTLCLGVLHNRDASGYEIKKMFEEGPLGHFLEASFGSIYPALTRLTKEGLVSFRDERQKGRPDKKVYSITGAGEAALREALMKPPAEDKLRSEFLFIAAFSDLIPVEHMRNLIDRQISLIRERQECLELRTSASESEGVRFAHGFALALCQTAVDYLEKHRQSLEAKPLQETLKEERACNAVP
jgi:DNA-binding PadR family transcriptional regulator